MACRLTGAKPLSETMMEYCYLTHGKEFQWNLNRNVYIFIQENAFENVVWKMAAILSRPVNITAGGRLYFNMAYEWQAAVMAGSEKSR